VIIGGGDEMRQRMHLTSANVTPPEKKMVGKDLVMFTIR
jgi:hypothetical protein